MIKQIKASMKAHVKHRIWLFSDLQQECPDKTHAILKAAIDDFTSYGLPCDMIWYLGDAVAGNNHEQLEASVHVQLELLKALHIPVRFVLGNHDFDYARSTGHIKSHFFNSVQQTKGWRTIDSLQHFYFFDEIGDYRLLFLSDHIDEQGKWISTHGNIPSETEYPYHKEIYSQLREKLVTSDKPVITLSHYAYSGGNRPSDLWDQLLPLPEKVKVHFFGHSHIGDGVWGKEHLYRKIAYVNHQSTPQINISSLENERADEIRSVMLEIYEDSSLGIYFRDHGKQAWANMLLIPPS
jgi:calcineurin-like phosphoesterase family protein